MKWLKFFIGAPLLRSVTFTTQTQIWYGSSKIKKKPFYWAYKRANRKRSDGGKTGSKKRLEQAGSAEECPRTKT